MIERYAYIQLPENLIAAWSLPYTLRLLIRLCFRSETLSFPVVPEIEDFQSPLMQIPLARKPRK